MTVSSVTKQRIAFAGIICSGKSYAAKQLAKKIPAKILSLSTPIKEKLKGTQFENRVGYQLIGKLGRSIDPKVWVDILTKRISSLEPELNIIVDDIRYENELIALRSKGFKIVYMKTPWHLRLQRLQKRNQDVHQLEFDGFVKSFTDESERQLEDLPASIFDVVIKSEDELEAYLKVF